LSSPGGLKASAVPDLARKLHELLWGTRATLYVAVIYEDPGVSLLSPTVCTGA